MKKAISVFILLAFPVLSALTQTNNNQAATMWNKSVHVEAGFIYPQGNIRESIPIRQNISYYSVNQYSSGYISSSTSGLLLGIRYEYELPKIRSAISTGLRFTGINTEISGYTSAKSDFFYLRYSMQESDTKFARVKSLSEDNFFLSVPLEVRVFPFQFKGLSFYAMAGLEYSVVTLKRAVDISFHNEQMDMHKDEVLESIAGPENRNYSTFYGALGMKIGREDKINYSFEIMLPSVPLIRNNYSLIDVEYIEGFRLSIQLPLRNNK